MGVIDICGWHYKHAAVFIDGGYSAPGLVFIFANRLGYSFVFAVMTYVVCRKYTNMAIYAAYSAASQVVVVANTLLQSTLHSM